MNHETFNNSDILSINDRWVLRGDPSYNQYCLYNIDTRKLITLTPALFIVLKLFYSNAMSFDNAMMYLNKNGIELPYTTICDFISGFSLEGVFSKRAISSQKHLNPLGRNMKYPVPVTSTPMDIELHFTHNCNLKCKHCFQSSEPNSNKTSLLSFDEWDQIFAQFEQANVLSVVISGGEPLIYPNAIELLRKVSNYKLSLSILTNGLLINENNIDVFCQPNITTTISLDGESEATHEYLRGKNTFHKTERAIKLLLQNGATINIAHTVHRHNFKNLENFIKYLIGLNIPNVSIGIVEPEGRAAINHDMILSKEEEREIFNEIRTLSEKFKDSINIDFPNLSYKQNFDDFSTATSIYCAAGTKRLAISSDGTVYPCVYAFGNKYLEIGSLKSEPLQQLWENPTKWDNCRGKIMLHQIEVCSTCELSQHCSLRNCRIKYYSKEKGLFAKPYNCLKDKV
jgi:radical SAM protein with 4Fe4S-binding SPASM domain